MHVHPGTPWLVGSDSIQAQGGAQSLALLLIQAQSITVIIVVALHVPIAEAIGILARGLLEALAETLVIAHQGGLVGGHGDVLAGAVAAGEETVARGTVGGVHGRVRGLLIVGWTIHKWAEGGELGPLLRGRHRGRRAGAAAGPLAVDHSHPIQHVIQPQASDLQGGAALGLDHKFHAHIGALGHMQCPDSHVAPLTVGQSDEIGFRGFIAVELLANGASGLLFRGVDTGKP
mmetsp:Transcript_111019/g.254495  ORF Transcript_111019/g.254495 Transcript_111019/m.254495 type:complete len:232 (-) Transcript_111019:37-732(-)